MKTKKYLLLTLFLLSAVMLLHALPMEEDQLPIEEKEIASKVANPVDTAGVRAHDARTVAGAGKSTAQSTSYSNIAVSETEQTTSTSVTDSSASIDDSPEGLAQKINEANAAAAAWQQEYNRVAALSTITAEGAEDLHQQASDAVAYWRQEQSRYTTFVEALDKKKESQKRRAFRPVIEACEEASEAAEKVQEQLDQKLKIVSQRIISNKDETLQCDPPKEIDKYLKNEIINNIYRICLAEVAKLSLEDHIVSENNLLKTQEWVAAKAAVKHYINKCNEDIKKFEREARESKKVAEKTAEEIVTLSNKTNERGDVTITTNINYKKACAAYAASKCQTKELALKLAEARLSTAHANLFAIKVVNNPSRLTAEAELEQCKRREASARNDLEIAEADLEAKELCVSSSRSALAAARIPQKKGFDVTHSVAEDAEDPVIIDELYEEIGKTILGKITRGNAETFEENLQATENSSHTTIDVANMTAEEFSRWNTRLDAWQKYDEFKKRTEIAHGRRRSGSTDSVEYNKTASKAAHAGENWLELAELTGEDDPLKDAKYSDDKNSFAARPKAIERARLAAIVDADRFFDAGSNFVIRYQQASAKWSDLANFDASIAAVLTNGSQAIELAKKALKEADRKSNRRAIIKKYKNSVKSYLKKEEEDWRNLNDEERSVYNKAAKADNEDRIIIFKEEESKAIDRVIEANKQINQYWMPSSRRVAEKALEREIVKLIQIRTTERERQKAIRWAQITSEEMTAEIELEQAENTGTVSALNAFYNKVKSVVATLEEKIKVQNILNENSELALLKKQYEHWKKLLIIACDKTYFAQAKINWNSFSQAYKNLGWSYWSKIPQLRPLADTAENAIIEIASNIIVRNDDMPYLEIAANSALNDAMSNAPWSDAVNNIIKAAAENDRRYGLPFDRYRDASIFTIKIAAKAAAAAAWNAIATKSTEFVIAETAVKTAKLLTASKHNLLKAINEVANAWAASKEFWNDGYDTYIKEKSVSQVAAVVKRIHNATAHYMQAVEADSNWNISQKDQDALIAAERAAQEVARFIDYKINEIPLSISAIDQGITKAVRDAAISSTASATESDIIKSNYSTSDNIIDVSAAWLALARIIENELINADKILASAINKLSEARGITDKTSVRAAADIAAIKAATKAINTASDDVDVRYPLFLNDDAVAKADAEARSMSGALWYAAFGDATVRDSGRSNAAIATMAAWHACEAFRLATRAQDPSMATRYANIADRAAHKAFFEALIAHGTIWEKEVQWAAEVAREAHAFAKAVNIFFKPFGAESL